MKKFVTIEAEYGQEIEIALVAEGNREVGRLTIDGVPYHIERLKSTVLKRDYCVDRDVLYTPQHDKNGLCIMITPFSKE